MRNYIQFRKLTEEYNRPTLILIAAHDIVALEEVLFNCPFPEKKVIVHTRDTKCYSVEETLEEISDLIKVSDMYPVITKEKLEERNQWIESRKEAQLKKEQEEKDHVK
jgi:hypothetical protein